MRMSLSILQGAWIQERVDYMYCKLSRHEIENGERTIQDNITPQGFLEYRAQRTDRTSRWRQGVKV